jgi:L-lactate dehydrogenase complex protein LldE
MRVALFVPCFIEHLQPEVALAAARVLKHLGHEVVVPRGQTCCGQPAINMGAWSAAVGAARHFLRVFGRCEADAIVCPSASCTATVRHGYERLPLSRRNKARLEAMTPRVFEFTEFLVDVTGTVDLGATLDRAVALHQSCHSLRVLGLTDQPARLLNRVSGLRLVELTRREDCCGFGGAFAVKLPEVSTAAADDKLADALAVGAGTLASVDSSCLAHLDGRARRLGLSLKVAHVAELLAEGLGLT